MERAEAERMEADYSRAYAEFSVKHAQNAPLVEALNKVRRALRCAGLRCAAGGLLCRQWAVGGCWAGCGWWVLGWVRMGAGTWVEAKGGLCKRAWVNGKPRAAAFIARAMPSCSSLSVTALPLGSSYSRSCPSGRYIQTRTDGALNVLSYFFPPRAGAQIQEEKAALGAKLEALRATVAQLEAVDPEWESRERGECEELNKVRGAWGRVEGLHGGLGGAGWGWNGLEGGKPGPTVECHGWAVP